MDIQVLRWDKPMTPDEVRLRNELVEEGYSVYKWADSAGTSYRPHQHECNESIWVLEGTLEVGVAGQQFRLVPGDRLILPRNTLHTSHVPGPESCFYLIGEKD